MYFEFLLLRIACLYPLQLYQLDHFNFTCQFSRILYILDIFILCLPYALANTFSQAVVCLLTLWFPTLYFYAIMQQICKSLPFYYLGFLSYSRKFLHSAMMKLFFLLILLGLIIFLFLFFALGF